MPSVHIPDQPPFVLRVRLLTPLRAGGYRHEDDVVVRVDGTGRIAAVDTYRGADMRESVADTIDVRPMVLLPGMVDLHAHLPQLPNAGLGAGLDLLTWLERYVFPLERAFDRDTAERLAPGAFRAIAAAGTTTVMLYGAVYESSMDAAFEAAEAHGIRAVMGKVMMDRLRYDDRVADGRVLETSLRESASLIARWHGRDRGRLLYAVTPRFAVSCSAEMLRESAALARATATYWQTHLSEDRAEIAEVHRLFPDARDYVDVYERASALGPRTVVAHAIHLSTRELRRLVSTQTRVAHCPAANLFLGSGMMSLGAYLQAGLTVGLGSDVAGGPDLSLFSVMRSGAYTQNGLRAMRGDNHRSLSPLDWLRLGSLGGATALGLDDVIGSVEPGKDADVILVDPEMTAPLPGLAADAAEDLASRLIFRSHPDMVRAAWVRGRRLAGPERQDDPAPPGTE